LIIYYRYSTNCIRKLELPLLQRTQLLSGCTGRTKEEEY